jgi:hypothetical protein
MPLDSKVREEAMDEIITISIKNGEEDFAEGIASLGGASKEVAEKAIVPILKKKIEKMRNSSSIIEICGPMIGGISSTLKVLESYEIDVTGLMDEIAYILLEKRIFYFALSFAEKGSEEAKKKVINASLKEENGKSLLDRMGIGDPSEKLIMIRDLLKKDPQS